MTDPPLEARREIEQAHEEARRYHESLHQLLREVGFSVWADNEEDRAGQLEGAPDLVIDLHPGRLNCEVKVDLHTTNRLYIEVTGGRGCCTWHHTSADYGLFYFPTYVENWHPIALLIEVGLVRQLIESQEGRVYDPPDSVLEGLVIPFEDLTEHERVWLLTTEGWSDQFQLPPFSSTGSTTASEIYSPT